MCHFHLSLPRVISFCSLILYNFISNKNLLVLSPKSFSPFSEMAYIDSIDIFEISTSSYDRTNEINLLIEHFINPTNFDVYGLAFI